MQVPFVAQSLKNVDLALKIASRGGLPGADPLFVQKFEKVLHRLLRALRGLASSLHA